MRVIDDWNANRDLALLAEIRIGAGRLIVSAIDLVDGLDDRPVARAFRRALSDYASTSVAEDIPVTTGTELERWWQRISA